MFFRHGILAMPVVFLLSGLAFAAPPVDLQAELGFGGWIVPGVWIPLRIDIATRVAIEGEVIISVGGTHRESMSWHHPLNLGAGTRQRLNLDVIVDDVRQPVQLSIFSRGDLFAQQTIATGAQRAAEGVVVALTEDAAGLEIVTDLPRRLRPAYLSEAQLPVHWQDYEGVALVVLRDLDDTRLSPSQREALIQWVAQGGHLLVTGGDSSALQVSWLRDLLPARPRGATNSIVLLATTGTKRPVPIVAIQPRPNAQRITDAGTVVAARWSYGRGVVTLWAFDPLRPDARGWPTRRGLWSNLLEIRAGPRVASVDLARVLPTSQSLPGRAQAGLAVLLVLYIFVVRYAQQRWVPHRGGWLILVAATLAMGGIMYTFAITARGSTIASTQVTLIEALPGLQLARAATYVSIVNPYGGVYRLEGMGDAVLRPVDRIPVTFLGAPNRLSASGAGRGLMFEALQMIPQHVAARVTEGDGGAELIVSTDPGARISGPVLFLRGRLYPLPDFDDRLSLVLDPTRWEGLQARGPIPQDLRSQIRHALYTRLRETDHLRERLWLVAWVNDPRPRVTLSNNPTAPALELLVVEVATAR